MKNQLILMFACSILISCSAQTKQNKIVNLEEMTPDQKASYSYGILLADNLKKGNMNDLDGQLIAQAMEDFKSGEEPLISPAEASTTFQAYAKGQQEIQTAKDQAGAQENLLAGQKYLEDNKNNEGVITLPSGLQYKVITEGTGAIPGPTDKVKTHYHGTLIDGTVFDSSVDRGEPISFGVNGVIKGWTEALQLMPVGSKWKLFVPADLAYGANPRPGGVIKPNMALIFDVELLDIEK